MSGSSVPEAARAAALAAWKATKAEPGGWDANVIRFIDAALAAAAPFIVAAAVAEERATTAAFLADLYSRQHMPMAYAADIDQFGCEVLGIDVAALASPGGGE